jgi:hypothetical protein
MQTSHATKRRYPHATPLFILSRLSLQIKVSPLLRLVLALLIALTEGTKVGKTYTGKLSLHVSRQVSDLKL